MDRIFIVLAKPLTTDPQENSHRGKLPYPKSVWHFSYMAICVGKLPYVFNSINKLCFTFPEVPLGQHGFKGQCLLHLNQIHVKTQKQHQGQISVYRLSSCKILNLFCVFSDMCSQISYIRGCTCTVLEFVLLFVTVYFEMCS